MDSDEDDYVVYGTPFPDFDDFNLKRKQAADLVVRDQQGRQRFHGAFTGGFSAGYFNTVGTKEGWTPSNFVSSRSQKASSLRQNPEDFMDDEDFGVFGIAPKTVHTTSDFHDSNADSSRKRKRIDDTDTIIPGEPPLKDLIQPVRESIGIKILKKMGWRHGQGIGPKVKKDTGIKVYGCSLGPLLPPGEKTSPDFDALEFAPDETPEVPYVPKDDYHGIGYSGLSTKSVLSAPGHFSASSTKTWMPKDQKKLKISGQAFGVGALEDDDEDIYGREDMSQYDFSELLDPGPAGKDSGPSARKDEAHLRIGVLEGFTPSTKPSTAKKHYPVPEVPRDFKPKHMRNKITKEQSSDITKQKLNPAARSLLLGEKAFVKEVDAVIPKPHAEKLRSRFCAAPEDETPLFPPGLVGSLNSKPFAHDAEKQDRYEKFLQTGCNKDELHSSQPSWMTEWQKQQESDEFIKTASLLKPFSGSLNSRFESRSQLAMDLPPKVIPKKSESSSKEQSMRQTKPQPAREVFQWYPASLLCKRFNVPNPYPDSNFQGTPGSENRTKRSLFDCISFEEREPRMQSSSEEVQSNDVEKATAAEKLHVNETGTESSQDHDIQVVGETSINYRDAGQTIQKPSMDLFRDIFKSSSSEESDTEEPEKTEKVPVKEVDLPKVPEVADVLQNAKPAPSEQPKPVKKEAFGVFANIDLDALSRRTPAAAKSSDDIPSSAEKEKPNGSETNSVSQESPACDAVDDSTSSDVYGPPLPPGGTTSVTPISQYIHHKQPKHKHHKHKVKKKKKKKKKHSTKSESSSSHDDSDVEDVPPAVLIEKLKKLQKLQKHKRR